ncbi:MAG: CPBP family intramembrane metalloprotease [Microbacterium sp.]
MVLVASGERRSRLWWEIALVLAISVGQYAIYSLLSLVRSLIKAAQQGQALGDQQTQLNPTLADQAFWDALYQLLDIAFALALVGMVLYLLWESEASPFRRIGLDVAGFGRDVGRGLLIAAAIGIPGLGLYAAGRALGFTVAVVASPLDAAWYTVPLLVLSALRAALLEEVVMVGYLFTRLRQLGWGPWAIILSTAALRGVYHAYQGVGSILGNAVMGVVMGWCFRRWGRVMPLVAAHALLDVVAFVGYPLAASLWPGVFAPPS